MEENICEGKAMLYQCRDILFYKNCVKGKVLSTDSELGLRPTPDLLLICSGFVEHRNSKLLHHAWFNP